MVWFQSIHACFCGTEPCSNIVGVTPDTVNASFREKMNKDLKKMIFGC